MVRGVEEMAQTTRERQQTELQISVEVEEVVLSHSVLAESEGVV